MPWLTSGSRTELAVALLSASLVAWIVAIAQMRGMDAGPGTDLGAFGWFLGVWVTMMAAMMLPSVAPTVLMFVGVRRDAHPWLFVVGYLVVWVGFGLAAYVVYRIVRPASPGFLAWDAQGPWVAGGALAAAGIYQLTPLKRTCLRHCRFPLHFLIGGRQGPAGAVRLGLAHGIYCVGCCTGLMLVLFALGAMSIFWMAVVALVILFEKTLPAGESFARLLAIILVGLGLWVGVSPATVPGMTEPGATMEMQR